MKSSVPVTAALVLAVALAIILVTSPSAACMNPVAARLMVQRIFTVYPDIYREVRAGQLTPMGGMGMNQGINQGMNPFRPITPQGGQVIPQGQNLQPGGAGFLNP